MKKTSCKIESDCDRVCAYLKAATFAEGYYDHIYFECVNQYTPVDNIAHI